MAIMDNSRRVMIFKVPVEDMAPFVLDRFWDLKLVGQSVPDDAEIIGVEMYPFSRWFLVKASSDSFAVVPEANFIPMQDEFVKIASR